MTLDEFHSLLNWRVTELYLGNLYVGEVMRVVPEGWREFKAYKECPADTPEYIVKNRNFSIEHHKRHEAKPWRAWFMSNPDGKDIGYFETEEQAKNALVDCVFNAINGVKQ